MRKMLEAFKGLVAKCLKVSGYKVIFLPKQCDIILNYQEKMDSD